MAHINRCPQNPVQGDCTGVNEREGGLPKTTEAYTVIHLAGMSRYRPLEAPTAVA
jgi:hypothetical protein